MDDKIKNTSKPGVAYYHLPGLFEFYGLYRMFLPLFYHHREYFYNWCAIGSIYGALGDCIWGGGRTSFGVQDPEDVMDLMREYGISARLTFSNSLLREEHLADIKCNALCKLFENSGGAQNGVIVHSDLLLRYLESRYPGLYFVSSTTKVLTEFPQLQAELNRDDFRYVVPDFRLNKEFEQLNNLPQPQKDKVDPDGRTLPQNLPRAPAALPQRPRGACRSGGDPDLRRPYSPARCCSSADSPCADIHTRSRRSRHP